MRILFLNPGVSEVYHDHIAALAAAWPQTKTLKRDLLAHRRAAARVFQGLGLLTAAACLPPEIDWDFVDENREPIDRMTGIVSNYDAVALTSQVIQRHRARELIDLFTARGVPVAVGGVHPTAFPDDYAGSGVSVFIGEGEPLLPRFLKDLARGRPKPIYRPLAKGENRGVDLAACPTPDYAALSSYRYSLIGLQAGRGCPYRCDYCGVTDLLGSAYRHSPVGRLVDQAARIKGLWPEAMFYFYDDNLLADRTYAVDLLTKLKAVPLGRWGTHADISVAEDDELLGLMTALGRPRLAIGFETLSPANAAALGNRMKQQHLSKYDQAVRRLRERGVEATGSFMFGFPGDGPAELDQILTFFDRHGVDGYITRYSAIPGSAMYARLERELTDRDGPLTVTGSARAALVNRYLMEKSGYGWTETEELILAALKQAHPDRPPLPGLDALAVFRCFFHD